MPGFNVSDESTSVRACSSSAAAAGAVLDLADVHGDARGLDLEQGTRDGVDQRRERRGQRVAPVGQLPGERAVELRAVAAHPAEGARQPTGRLEVGRRPGR